MSRRPRLGADLPVGDPLVRRRRPGAPRASGRTHDVVLGPDAVGGVVGRAGWGGRGAAWRTSSWAASASAREARLLVAQGPAPGGQRLGGRPASPARRASPTCRESVLHLGPEFVPPAHRARAARVERRPGGRSRPGPPRAGRGRPSPPSGRPAPAGCRSWWHHGSVTARGRRHRPRCHADRLPRRWSSATAPLTAVDGLSFAGRAPARSSPCSVPTAPARPHRRDPGGLPAGRPRGTVRVLGLDPAADHAPWWPGWG